MNRGGQGEVLQNGIYNAWVLVHRAEDLPDTWVAHALEFDVVSQGATAQQAIEMLREAVCIVLHDCAEEGRDPYGQRAPAEYWAKLESILEHGEQFPVEELRDRTETDGIGLIAVQAFFMQKRKPAEDQRPSIRTPLFVRAQQESAAAC